MTNLLDIPLECPATRLPLQQVSTTKISSSGGPDYAIDNGIIRFAPQADPNAQESGARDFYEKFGWQRDEDGNFREHKAALDFRGPSIAFTRRCMTRLGKYFSSGGQYLLDAGSGPIPHKELLPYGNAFEKRICLDLSFRALEMARAQLGDRGIYIQGDISKLPIKSNSIDAVTCNHVIYQVPPELQPAAFKELWRVLKPGGVCVAVYWWPNPKLPWKLTRIARLLGLRGEANTESTSENAPSVFHNNPFPRSWFDAQPWPFRYEYDVYRVVDNGFMKNEISNDWRGHAFLSALYAAQVLAPGFCGKHGSMPAIIIRKDK